MDFDDRFIDVDFSQQPQFVRGDLGRNPACASPRFAEDVISVLSESEQRAIAERLEAEGGGLDRLVTRIYNQSNEGSCVANMAGQMHEVLQAAAFGKSAVIPLSAISLYKRIGRSPGSGAMVEDALDEGTSRGILPLNTDANKQRFPHTMPHTGFYTAFPSGWEATAKLFAYSERLIVQSEAGLRSALLKGFPVGVGREGHSILYLRPVWKNDRWYTLYVNSWDTSWGQAMHGHAGGFGLDSSSQTSKSSGWAYAVRSIRSAQSLNVST